MGTRFPSPTFRRRLDLFQSVLCCHSSASPIPGIDRDNQQKAGATNVEFLKGEMESIPLPVNSVDVSISNCVINLSADKERVLGERFRMLKPGGRLTVSDLVVRGEVPAEVRQSMQPWVG